MKRQKISLLALGLLSSLSMIGCQPSMPLDLSPRLSSFNKRPNSNTNTPVDLSSLTNSNSNSSSSGSSTTTFPAASARCSSKSTQLQNFKDSCYREVDYYYDDIREAAPNCLSAFYNLSPMNCNTLESQITTLRSSCSLITQYSSYFPNCSRGLSSL
jgi:hypothetical protein